ncbi:MAG: 2-phosphosulfolactate phosphatase [Phycisphaerales bacterium]|nr:2-phosphosulfolactate phosphatase [Phycisphaerales bacterium]
MPADSTADLKVHGFARHEDLPDVPSVSAVGVVVDVLRASTTIMTALHAGAQAVSPVGTPEEAMRRRAMVGTRKALAGGERGGLPAPGFDLGNSPAEYTREKVGGRTIFLTTTNGTAALLRLSMLHRVLVGGLVNRTAVANALVDHRGPVFMVASGTDGQPTEEDLIGAGAMIEALGRHRSLDLDRCAESMLTSWRALDGDADAVLRALQTSTGGRNLAAIGLDRDVHDAARVDNIPIVGALALHTVGGIHVAAIKRLR